MGWEMLQTNGECGPAPEWVVVALPQCVTNNEWATDDVDRQTHVEDRFSEEDHIHEGLLMD